MDEEGWFFADREGSDDSYSIDDLVTVYHLKEVILHVFYLLWMVGFLLFEFRQPASPWPALSSPPCDEHHHHQARRKRIIHTVPSLPWLAYIYLLLSYKVRAGRL